MCTFSVHSLFSRNNFAIKCKFSIFNVLQMDLQKIEKRSARKKKGTETTYFNAHEIV